MCSNTGNVPSWVGAAGTPVLPGELRITRAVVPEVERLRHAAVDEDVAVAAVAALAGERVADQRAPDPGPASASTARSCVVLEHHHRAAGDLVRPARPPERAQLRRRVRVAPDELPRRRRRARRRAAPAREAARHRRSAASRRAGSRAGRAAAAAATSSPPGPATRAFASASSRLPGEVSGARQLDAHVRAEPEAEAARLEGERVGVQQPPAARSRRREPRPRGRRARRATGPEKVSVEPPVRRERRARASARPAAARTAAPGTS